MDIFLVFTISFLLLVFSILKGIFIGYPLMICFVLFVLLALRKGFLIKDILKMSYNGGKKVFLVLRIFLLIGAITAAWMASGTVAGIVYYGIELMHPQYFLLYAFMICVVISFLLGTAFGTVSTVGVALMVMARGGGININMAAGAIIAGAYFGDRSSPMSSSANLVATLTETQLYRNIKNMFKTAIIPFVIAGILYTLLSISHPLNLVESTIGTEIKNTFLVDWRVLLPAGMILIFAILRLDVKLSMLLSIITALGLAVFLQGYSLMEILDFTLFGFHLDAANPLKDIIKGGGIFSMVNAAITVFVSSSLSGLLDGTGMLKNFEAIFAKAKTYFNLFLYTCITATLTAAFGCNQTMSIILTSQLLRKSYRDHGLDKHQQAVDIENTSVVIAPLIPWNIAGLVPTTTLMVSSAGFLPYAFYLYLIPITHLLYLAFQKKDFKITTSETEK